MDQARWNISIPKRMFKPTAYRNIDKFFDLIDKALDVEINAAQAKVKKTSFQTPKSAADQFQQDRIRLKLYAFATIAVENDKFGCNDEYVNSFNTLGAFSAKFDKSIGYVPPTSLPTLRPLRGAPTHPWKLGEFNLTRPFGLYDYRGDLGNHSEGIGERYKGRGFFQLTGLYNYSLFSRLARIPGLATHPEWAGRPENAARILAAYVLHHQDRILAALNKRDFLAARKVVNSGALGWKDFRAAYTQGEKALE